MINFSSLILNDSIKFLISYPFKLFNLVTSSETTAIFINCLNASLNALSMTFSFLKLRSNGSDISISFTLNMDDFNSEVEKFKNRTVIKKII